MAPSRRSFTIQFKPEILKYISDKGCFGAGILELTKKTYGSRKLNQILYIHRVVKDGLLKTTQLFSRSPLS